VHFPVSQLSPTFSCADLCFLFLSSSSNSIEIIWQKNSVLIDQTNGRFHIGPYNRTLEVRGIIADDQGIYSCHVRIRNSENFINASAKLVVRGK
jgi:hypothetical protein